jgi:TonB family protein
MKLTLLPVFALALLLSACSTSSSNSVQAPTGPAIPAGNKVTQWGELPSYEPAGHHFSGVTAPHLGPLQVNGELKLDLLVNPDGTIQDIAIFESSGDKVVDQIAASAFKKARYSLRLSANDPAPYVVRLTMGLKTTSVQNGHDQRYIDTRNYSSAGPTPPTQSYSTSP